jgi:uncharacterized tellurite resistance protein B-like protein|tara:strand:- start:1134 stop:1553 length:420 start_codon:yes stop_codon:yes gene_type:complete
MFKNIFKKNQSNDVSDSMEIDVVLRLMFEIAMSDGSLDKSELDLLKKRAGQISTANEKASDVIKKVIDDAGSSTSLYPTVTKINAEYSLEQKKEILKKLWGLVTVDGIIDHYEENLYFKIAELIKIKRSQANQIKQENS